MEDEKIVALFWARSEEAIQQTQAHYGKYLHRIAHGILASHEDAAECVNDTLFAAWNAIPPQKPSRLSAFLGKIVRNTALNRLAAERALKRNGKMLEILDEMSEVLPIYQGGETLTDELALKDAIDSFLASLPELARKVFVQRYFFCRSIKEIAREFDLSESNVSVMLHRARGECKHHLEKEGISL